MSTLLDLLTQKQPQFQTHQALLVLDLQNDFLQADGKLPVQSRGVLLSRIKRLVPIFRDTAGDVIWVRSVYEQDRGANDGSDEGDVVVTSFEGEKDDDIAEDGSSSKEASASPPPQSPKTGGRAREILKKVTRKTTAPAESAKADGDEPELFLSTTTTRQPCFVANSVGAEFAGDIKKSIDPASDIIIKKSHYSAFRSTQLLMTLRMRLVTELYICGCMSNISVYATALDAARHGLTINIVEDCLGYRRPGRHQEAMRQMAEIMGAYTATSTDLIQDLADQDPDANIGPARVVSPEPEPGHINSMVQRMSLSDTSSLYSARGEGTRGSIEHRRTESGNTETTHKSLSDTIPLLSRKRSGKLQKKQAPVPQSPTEPPAAAETGGRTLKYKRSKIRMRKRESSVGAKDRPAAPADPSSAEPLPKGADESPGQSPAKPGVNATVADELKQTPNSDAAARAASPPANGAVVGRAGISATSPRSPTFPDGVMIKERAKSGSPSPQKSIPNVKSTYAKHSASSSADMTADSKIGEGDSYLSTSIMPKEVSKTIFWDLYNEVRWQVMYHQTGSVPRLVCVQGDSAEKGSMPVYRHPTDHSLPLLHLSPAVRQVRTRAEAVVGHPLNHVLIQLYRSGQDYISEHSDKTLDIVRGSSIVNVSFGAQRTMRLRTKKSALDQQSVSFADAARQTQRVALPHNSAFVLGQETNMRWLHGINPDKRPQSERSKEEKAFDGMRISLTFRHIGTFLNSDSTLIWGQGATHKTSEDPAAVVNGEQELTDALIRAFGKENQATEFSWPDTYGAGFDVLHFRSDADSEKANDGAAALLFLSTSGVENDQARIYLDYVGIAYRAVEPPPGEGSDDMGSIKSVCFRDCDAAHTEVSGAVAVLLYLARTQPLRNRKRAVEADLENEKQDAVQPAEEAEESRTSLARTYELLITLPAAVRSGQKSLLKSMEARFDDNTGFVAGEHFGIADCAYFPVLERFRGGWDERADGKIPRVKAYLGRVRTQLGTGARLARGVM